MNKTLKNDSDLCTHSWFLSPRFARYFPLRVEEADIKEKEIMIFI